MPKSLEEVLEWYKVTVFKLRETANVNDFLFRQTLIELLSDGGEKADEALCALAYCACDLDNFNITLATVSNFILKHNEDLEVRNCVSELVTLINKLKELHNSLLMDGVLETKFNFNKVINEVTKELINIHSEKINKQSISMCRAGHSFIALSDHPTVDGELLCPYCVSVKIN